MAARRKETSMKRRPTRRAGVVTSAAGAALLSGAAVAVTSHEHGAETSARADEMPGMAMPATSAGHWRATAGDPFQSDGVTRSYFISADKVVWDYAPRHRNMITGRPFDSVADTYIRRGRGRIGSRYVKCLYRGYTDATFKHLQQRPADQRYLGLLGPVIRAQVGDTIRVVFRNTCRFRASVHPHGVFYDKDSEGAPSNDGTRGVAKADDAVPRGGRHTYTWRVPERAGPAPGDGSSVMWMYHSHADEVSDTYAGLMGPIEITRAGMARPDGSPDDVDRDFFVLFSVMNENESPFLKPNLRRFARRPFPRHPEEDDDFQESNLMHSINGHVF